MPRIKDVDVVAPDDPVVVPATPTTTPTPSLTTSSSSTSTPTPISDKIYNLFGHTTSPFSSSLILPHVFNFAEQNDDEKILLAMRPHWFTNVRWIIVAVLLFLAPPLLKFVPLINTMPLNYQFIISLAWYLVATAYSFENFLGWYFDVYIITDHRVVDIDFINILTKHFAEADLSKIQDVSSQVSGVSQTFLNYGDVLIQTAAEVNEIHFMKVPNPEKVVKILQDLTELEEHSHSGI